MKELLALVAGAVLLHAIPVSAQTSDAVCRMEDAPKQAEPAQVPAKKKAPATPIPTPTPNPTESANGNGSATATPSPSPSPTATTAGTGDASGSPTETAAGTGEENGSPPPSTAAVAYQRTRAGGLLPANTLDEAKRDPRFQIAAVDGDARIKVVTLARGYPYFGISDNGCSPGKQFVTAELLGPFDGLPAGTPIVLRMAESGEARAGATLAVNGLRRAGKGRDGTFVYCGGAAAAAPR